MKVTLQYFLMKLE